MKNEQNNSLDIIVHETQRELQSIFVKPKCSEKLLKKPPFRFIHDIVTAIITATDEGFPAEIFEDRELDSSNVKDKQSKLAFLDKIIKLVNQSEGRDLNVKAIKIAAGLEPHSTNMLLRGLAKAAKETPARRAIILEQYHSSDHDSREMTNDKLSEVSKITLGEKREDLVIATDGVERTIEYIDVSLVLSLPLIDRIARCNKDTHQTKAFVEHVITRPKCTDKLLSRPPFRFLHDIIIAVIQATGFASHLYDRDEMDSSRIKDKKHKILFLTMLVEFIESQLPVEIEAMPGKIVAGLEPEATCHLLQILIVAATASSEEIRAINKAGEALTEQSIEAEQSNVEVCYDGGNEIKDNKTSVQDDPKEPTEFVPEYCKDLSNFQTLSIKEKLSLCNSDILQTRLLVEQITSKPKCTDKLLNRPPFRFLHDVITGVIKATGFASKIYEEDEMDASRIADKQDKIAFLVKIISHVEKTLDSEVRANPKKIVAGLEAESTCEFLQLLVIAATIAPVEESVEEHQHNAVYTSKANPNLSKTTEALNSENPGENLSHSSSRVSVDSEDEFIEDKNVDENKTNVDIMDESLISNSSIDIKTVEKHREVKADIFQPSHHLRSLRPTTARPATAARPTTARRGPPKMTSSNQPKVVDLQFEQEVSTAIGGATEYESDTEASKSELFDEDVAGGGNDLKILPVVDNDGLEEEENSKKKILKSGGILLNLSLKPAGKKSSALSPNTGPIRDEDFINFGETLQDLVKSTSTICNYISHFPDNLREMKIEREKSILEYHKTNQEALQVQREAREELIPLYETLYTLEHKIKMQKEVDDRRRISIRKNQIYLSRHIDNALSSH